MPVADIDVSVIIVNWNTRRYLLDVISSLKKTTRHTRMEIIVVDNASEDGSGEALRKAHPEVLLIENSENLGFSKANNIGFRAARGHAFCLVNTDIIAHDGVVDRLWDYLKQHPAVGMVGPKTYDSDGKTWHNCRRFPNLVNAAADTLWLRHIGLPGRALPASSFEHTHDAEVLSGCFLMVRRTAVDDIGTLDEDFFFYGEDTDWGKRFHAEGWRAVFLHEATAVHFGGGSSAAYPVRYYLIMEKADLRYWQKHHMPVETTVYVLLRLIHHATRVVGWSFIWLTSPTRRDLAALKVRGSANNARWLVTSRKD